MTAGTGLLRRCGNDLTLEESSPFVLIFRGKGATLGGFRPFPLVRRP